MLLKCAWFLNRVRNDKMLANLLKRIFDDLRIDSRSQSIKSNSLPLYKLQAANLRHMGQAEYAVQLLEQIVKIRETTLDEDHPSRLASQHVLAVSYQENGQTRQAVQLLEKVVNIEKTTLDEDHPSRQASQHVLAGAYQENGQIGQAVQLLGKVVKIQETILDEDHPSRLAL